MERHASIRPRTWERLKKTALIALGYILSPLSWWNDVVVNLPIAYGVASLVAWFSPRLFLPALILTYWATNVLGLVLMHKGIVDMVKPGRSKNQRRELLVTMAVFTFYSLLVIVLVLAGWLKPLAFR
ncbi:MAG: hypothetical protein ONB23_06450 [candidate division KSB1 bacterium]|nr:hypothetical protein [candidate division KSB1 bacterium]